MRRITALLFAGVVAASVLSAAHHEKHDRQYIEVRTYHLSSADELPAVDAYMEKALLPALRRQGVVNVGVLGEYEASENPRIFVMIPFDTIEQFAGSQAKLDADAEYQKAAADYFGVPKDEPRFKRIESELLYSFEVWPQMKVPAQKKAGKARLFELRTYESHSEEFGERKVEMFNAGEVPIFLDAGIQPVFMGRALVGKYTPNLTYMTVFDDMDAVEAGWKAFRVHPDWKKLSGVEKYKGTVSNIHKTWLTPRPYSGL